ncbi:MAG: hypothetical protein EOP47_26440 [Sphingobacteriaceae bacterium]|nr:MAG: hypothetical protein EOP47_26440 [Sphingobacteriaceae bacterium]
METSYEVNTTIFPQTVNSSVGNGEYYQGVTSSIPTNITTFLAGSVNIGKRGNVNGEIMSDDIACNNLYSNTANLQTITSSSGTFSSSFSCPRRYIPSFIGVMLVTTNGTTNPFPNGTSADVISQSWNQQTVPCSMARLPSVNDDRAITLAPGYSVTLYRDPRWGGNWTTIVNNSDTVASVRTAALNNSGNAVWDGVSWSGINASYGGLYGQLNSSSIRIYYNGVEVSASTVFGSW